MHTTRTTELLTMTPERERERQLERDVAKTDKKRQNNNGTKKSIATENECVV